MDKRKYTGMTLDDRILQIDHVQARRLGKLMGDARQIATQGIIRHLRACARMEVNPGADSIREIIDDALNGRRVFAESDNDHSDVSRPEYGNGNQL